MEILLKDIPDHGLDIAYEETPDLLGLVDKDVTFEDQIAVRGSLTRAGEAVTLAGWLTARLVLPCSRCAKDFTLPIHLDLAVQFLPFASPSMPAPDEDEEDRMEGEDPYFYRGQSIILDNFIREEVILAVPMQPLCNSDCKGLCSRCGQDLNIAVCGCSRKESVFPVNRAVKNNKKKMV